MTSKLNQEDDLVVVELEATRLEASVHLKLFDESPTTKSVCVTRSFEAVASINSYSFFSRRVAGVHVRCLGIGSFDST